MWHDIFKVPKGKNLQPKILYPIMLSFRIEEIKISQTKFKGVHHHSISHIRNVKGNSLSRKKWPSGKNKNIIKGKNFTGTCKHNTSSRLVTYKTSIIKPQKQ